MYSPTCTGYNPYTASILNPYDMSSIATYKPITYRDNVTNSYYSKIVECSTIVSYQKSHKTYCTSDMTEIYGISSWASAINDYCTYKNMWRNASGYGYDCRDWAPVPPLPLSDRFRQILQSRQTPRFITSRTPIKAASEERELRARQTLRKVLGDDGFQRFLRNGFVSVRANSGKVYQIYPGHGMTIVYDRGTPVEKLCVILRGDFTPTDSLITRYVMILHDEASFRVLANVFSAPARQIATLKQLDTRPLMQIFQSLKSAA